MFGLDPINLNQAEQTTGIQTLLLKGEPKTLPPLAARLHRRHVEFMLSWNFMTSREIYVSFFRRSLGKGERGFY
jgi:hypothetical protein